MARDYEHWPYSASIAWGLWRTKSALLRAWGDDTIPGISAIGMRAADPATLFPDEGEALAPLDVIEADIRAALLAGRITATGISPRYSAEGRMSIPASFWDGAMPIGSEVDRFIKRDERGTGWTPFFDILLNARQLVRAFPQPREEQPALADAVLKVASDETVAEQGHPIKRKPEQAPEPLRRFLCEYLLAEHGGKWPPSTVSLSKIRDGMITWVSAKYGRPVARQLGKTATSSISRFRDNQTAFNKAMQYVRSQTQQ